MLKGFICFFKASLEEEDRDTVPKTIEGDDFEGFLCFFKAS